VASLTSDATLGTGRSIGRYFGLVSTVPSVVLAGWLWLLWATGALTGPPDFALVGKQLQDVSVPAAALGFLGILALALVTHPLQFSLVQLFEGYWGRSQLGRRWRVNRTDAHIRSLTDARARERGAKNLLKLHGPAGVAKLLKGPESPQRRAVLVALVDQQVASRINARYPDYVTNVLPTALGNVLRRHELRAGASSALPILSFATHIGMVADAAHTDYVQDQRNDLDLAVRVSATAVLATIATVLVMWPHGLWLLMALVPYTAAWMAYRGAVSVAATYGAALGAWVDLTRPRLYDALEIDHPATAQLERERNKHLADMVNGSLGFTMRYATADRATGKTGLGSRSPSVRRRPKT
jgi:hypothetical protein